MEVYIEIVCDQQGKMYTYKLMFLL